MKRGSTFKENHQCCSALVLLSNEKVKNYRISAPPQKKIPKITINNLLRTGSDHRPIYVQAVTVIDYNNNNNNIIIINNTTKVLNIYSHTLYCLSRLRC